MSTSNDTAPPPSPWRTKLFTSYPDLCHRCGDPPSNLDATALGYLTRALTRERNRQTLDIWRPSEFQRGWMAARNFLDDVAHVISVEANGRISRPPLGKRGAGGIDADEDAGKPFAGGMGGDAEVGFHQRLLDLVRPVGLDCPGPEPEAMINDPVDAPLDNMKPEPNTPLNTKTKTKDLSAPSGSSSDDERFAEDETFNMSQLHAAYSGLVLRGNRVSLSARIKPAQLADEPVVKEPTDPTHFFDRYRQMPVFRHPRRDAVRPGQLAQIDGAISDYVKPRTGG